MASDADNDEVFDEEELADGFIEEIASEEELEDVVAEDGVDEDDADVDVVDSGLIEDDEAVALVAVAVEEDEDVVDDADVELALDEVLAETILRTSIPEDDDDSPTDIDPTLETVEAILPKQDDEFRCRSCRLLKKTSQLADHDNVLCRDCV